jgi:hypothetical protein
MRFDKRGFFKTYSVSSVQDEASPLRDVKGLQTRSRRMRHLIRNVSEKAF